MGNSQSDALGKKIRDGFDVIGKKMGEGWNEVKNFGNKVWDGVKSVPVLGKIAEGVEKYTPVGWAATNALKGIDTGIRAGSQVLRGDLKGAVQTGIDYGRSRLNAENPLITQAKKIPGIGGIVSSVQDKAQNIPVFGGASINTIKAVGNAALNSAQSFKEGDVQGGFTNLGRAGASYLGSKAGLAGKVGKVLGGL